jgi:uncharacterized Ntn-hydrolase superfamily protein
MTFSIAARCPDSGMFGAATTTRNIAVGARCIFARAGTGAVITQHVTDPGLGPLGLEFLARGATARQVIDDLVAGNPTIAWRELAVVDGGGGTAHYHGERVTTIHGAWAGEGCVAIGNGLADPGLPEAMGLAFQESAESPLSERLLRGLEAGLAAGGMVEPLATAALLVYDKDVFPLVDLRIDMDPRPLVRLRDLWRAYEPLIGYFRDRAVDPDGVGSPIDPPVA